MDRRRQVIAEVHDEWVRAGKLHDPPDDTSDDDDFAFWDEVERRWKEVGQDRPDFGVAPPCGLKPGE